MNQGRESESGKSHNATEWSNPSETLNKVSDTTDANISPQDDVKIKVEIELKEEENGLVYQPDFYGHLRLVSLNQVVTDESNANKLSDIREWHCVQQPLCASEMNGNTIVPSDENSNFGGECVYRQLNNVYDISNETDELGISNFQNSALAAPEIYDSSYTESSMQTEVPVFDQDSDICKRNPKKKELSCILAEKKRNYRNRIKEENPTMWCAMKQKEACKKREQREEKRFILLEMQKTMQLISLPDSPDVENNKLYLQALKERYPEIWKQLIDALAAAEQRNNELLNEQNCKRRLTKPVKMYKDVVEAQKKYLYRQRIKLERPDLYEQQKARDSYARSIRRMLKKKLSESQTNLNS